MNDAPNLPKPPHGQACTMCGWCCYHELCPLARRVFRRTIGIGPCPALEDGTEGRKVCGLVTHPATYVPVLAKSVGNNTLARAAKVAIGYGIGCDAFLPGEAENEAYSEHVERLADANHTAIANAFWVWKAI